MPVVMMLGMLKRHCLGLSSYGNYSMMKVVVTDEYHLTILRSFGAAGAFIEIVRKSNAMISIGSVNFRQTQPTSQTSTSS